MAVIKTLSIFATSFSQFTFTRSLSLLQNNITTIARAALAFFVVGLLVRLVRRGFTVPVYQNQYQQNFKGALSSSLRSQKISPVATPVNLSSQISPVSSPRIQTPVVRPTPAPAVPFVPVVSSSCQIALNQTKTQLQKISVPLLGLTLDEHVIFINETEKEIENLRNNGGSPVDLDAKEQELTNYLLSYGETFWEKMKLSNLSPNLGNPWIFNPQDVIPIQNLVSVQDILFFTQIMEKFPAETQFLINSFEKMEEFNKCCFFKSPTNLCLDETQKKRFTVLSHFFNVTNNYFPFIEFHNPQLAQDLKLKAANIPLRNDIDHPKAYPNLYLRDAEIIQILITHFEKLEENQVEKIIRNGSLNRLTDTDCKRLNKYVADSSTSDKNIKSLQGFSKSDNSYANNQDVQELHYAFCAKKFFQSQMGLSEEALYIPRWCHATWLKNFTNIINDGQIDVRHEKAYPGAWVSTQIEHNYGDSVFLFTRHIQKIDPKVFIGTEYKEQKRWRGLQKAISLMGKDSPHLAMVALSPNTDRKKKKDLHQQLKNMGHYNITKIYKKDFVDFMNKQIFARIGLPNQSEDWFGISR